MLDNSTHSYILARIKGKPTREPKIEPRLLIRNATRHLRILFLYQPLRVKASLFIFSKSLTSGALKVACHIPAKSPTPRTGLRTKNGAVIPDRRHVRGEAPPISVKTNVQVEFAITQ